jgi:hypothetical protein
MEGQKGETGGGWKRVTGGLIAKAHYMRVWKSLTETHYFVQLIYANDIVNREEKKRYILRVMNNKCQKVVYVT